MMKKTLIALALSSSLGISLAHADDVVVKIGVAAPLTGTQSHLGKDIENGARMALDEYAEKGLTIGGKTVKFEVMAEDDQADPRQATTVAQRLADANVAGVVGHLNSGASIPASRIYNDAGIPQISPASTNPTLTAQGYKAVFRTIANDVQQGQAIGKYAATKLGKKIAIIDDRTAYGQGLADQVEKAVKADGGKVIGREFTSDKATDFMAILTKIKAQKPDVIVYSGMDTQAGPMLKQIKQLGIDAKFITGDGGCTAEAIKLAGDSIGSSAYCTQPGLPLEQMPGGKTFNERYQKRFNGLTVQIYAPYAYDAASALVEAMKLANSTDPSKYASFIPKVSFDGVIGKVSFDAKGDIKGGAITVYQYKDGSWDPLK